MTGAHPKMPLYHGYPQHRDAHGLYPWWRYDVVSRCFVRSDDEVLTWDRPEAMDEAVAALHLAAYDKHQPLPVPPLMCGQVWAWPTGIASTIVHLQRSSDGAVRVEWGDGVVGEFDSENPAPQAALLVAGPFSPWAPGR